MSHIEADCSLIKKDGDLIGISLVAQPQTEAEIFCHSMPQKLMSGKGDIVFSEGKITFTDGDDDVSFSITDEDATITQTLLSSNKKLGIYKDGFLTPGFKIVLEGMESDGEKLELERI